MSESLKYKPESGWKRYDNELDRLKLAELARDYIEFISGCKTERETIAEATARLKAAGFKESGDRLLYPFREKALFAIIRGSLPLTGGLNLIAAHADSPRLDFKPHPFVEAAGIAQAKTHYYGGIRKYQWLARPLALHGVAIRENGEKINITIGEDQEDPVFCVADLLPHLAQKQETKTLKDAFDGEKLNIVLGHLPHDHDEDAKDPVLQTLLTILDKRYGLKEEDFITAELEAVPAGRASFVGFDKALIGGYGQDDRICVFCALQALLAVSSPERACAIILWDKEEIGSDGATGASSRYLQYCIERALAAWGESGVSATLFNTCAISADVTAALDPDYGDVHEKQNAARLGFGPCFSKYTGSGGKYGANDANAEFFASLRNLLNSGQIPWQAAELGKVGLGGGGTVAKFMASLGMDVIDLGPALLSMHSPFELSSVADLYATMQAYTTFFQKNL